MGTRSVIYAILKYLIIVAIVFVVLRWIPKDKPSIRDVLLTIILIILFIMITFRRRSLIYNIGCLGFVTA